MFIIRKKKIIDLIKSTQLEIRKENQAIKQSYCFKKDEKSKRFARDWQLYEDGCDNAFNLMISRIRKL